MRAKPIHTAAICTALALTTLTAPLAHADGAGKFIAGVALGVLGSAIAKEHHKNGGDYQNYPGLPPEENAIGLCMHRTHKAMSNQGYHHVDFESVISYEADVDGFTLVDLKVGRSSNSNYDARSYIKAHCAIQSDAVVHFRYTSY